ncbi:Immunogenic protein MPT70 precursor [Planctomycetes bacterium MalM25]|nr:Immunogenic protein MPT70 precursor [Planctomycetes bacterium MalM25]
MKSLALALAATLLTAPTLLACDTCGCKDAKHAAAHSEGAAHPHDIVDTAVEADGFTTLVAAVKAAGLVETLKGDGPFTVFAPTDEAFKKVDPATLASLLKPENKDQLVKILTHHVVPGKVMAAQVVGITEAETAAETKLPISVSGDTVTVDGAKVIVTDIECTNGVIHAIDTVMLP